MNRYCQAILNAHVHGPCKSFGEASTPTSGLVRWAFKSISNSDT